MSDLKEFLTSENFYLSTISRNDAAAYEKKALLQFDENGEITGIGNSSKFWEIQENELIFLKQEKQENDRFTISENFEEEISGKSEKTNSVLLPTKSTEIESLKVESSHDRQSMLSFVNMASPEYQQLREFAANDKTLDGYAEGNYFLVPRKLLNLGFSRDSDLEIDYMLEKPLKPDSKAPKNLVIEFHWLEHQDVSAYVRMYGTSKRPRNFRASLAPNTYVLRIADSNLISGSYFFNTENSPDYEENLQKFIQKIAAEEEIPLENIICYGFSRGGTAALYHAALGGYASVAVDPVVDRSPWLLNGRDLHLIFDFLPVSFLDKLSTVLVQTKSDSRQLQVICAEESEAVYPEILKLDLSKITLKNLKIKLNKGNPIGNHGQLFSKTFPLQLSTLNHFLYKLPD
ncbi:XcbB/CpsF family capsular polysaccharide biosynthesis protein [Lactovum odontotermitis]